MNADTRCTDCASFTPESNCNAIQLQGLTEPPHEIQAKACRAVKTLCAKDARWFVPKAAAETPAPA